MNDMNGDLQTSFRRAPTPVFHLAPRIALARNISLTCKRERAGHTHTRHTAPAPKKPSYSHCGYCALGACSLRDRWSLHRFRQTPTVSASILALSGHPDRMKPYCRLHGDNFKSSMGPKIILEMSVVPSANPPIFVPNHDKSHDEPPIILKNRFNF